ncbi:hypothetical protein [Paraburkholderia sp. BL21I4N1]|uniref:hypothetical protein n=1 Tax=Paraburkholderia sp. BL21I4N1 TaxID=1938801 RepID=UPI000CFC7D0C|nr:hypothetical protein [Paraburkholderia sp. BL21I4N1]PQV52631.1 hypothetical protein B0G83_103382 [Paraburkholderia sp. BL21I4N1]
MSSITTTSVSTATASGQNPMQSAARSFVGEGSTGNAPTNLSSLVSSLASALASANSAASQPAVDLSSDGRAGDATSA